MYRNKQYLRVGGSGVGDVIDKVMKMFNNRLFFLSNFPSTEPLTLPIGYQPLIVSAVFGVELSFALMPEALKSVLLVFKKQTNRVNCMVCELYFNKAVLKQGERKGLIICTSSKIGITGVYAG